MNEAFIHSVIRNQHIYTTLDEFATVNPDDISGANPATVSNYGKSANNSPSFLTFK